MKVLPFLLLLVVACGSSDAIDREPNPVAPPAATTQDELLVKRVEELELFSNSLSTVVFSDFAVCAASGETQPALINQICHVAQAATAEARVELKGQLASFVVGLDAKLEALNGDMSRSAVATLDALDQLEADIAGLDGRLVSAESAIDALESLTASITNTLNGAMVSLEIGTENLSAGPLYETILRRADRSRIVAFKEALAPTLSLPTNPVTATNGSSIVTIAKTAHGLTVGDIVHLEELAEWRVFTSGYLLGDFKVLTVPNANSFTVNLGVASDRNGSFGGSNGIAQKVLGKGLMVVWEILDGADTAVRVTSLGSQRYQFIIKANGDVCYDTATPLATFSVLAAGGGTVVCY